MHSELQPFQFWSEKCLTCFSKLLFSFIWITLNSIDVCWVMSFPPQSCVYLFWGKRQTLPGRFTRAVKKLKSINLGERSADNLWDVCPLSLWKQLIQSHLASAMAQHVKGTFSVLSKQLHAISKGLSIGAFIPSSSSGCNGVSALLTVNKSGQKPTQ